MPHSRIKLLHVIGTFLNGGTERLMLDILSRLDRGAFDITACAYGNQQLPSVVAAYQRAGIRTVTFHLQAGAQLVWALARYISRHGFEIVHTHHYQPNTYCRPAAILARTPIIMTYQHNWPGRERARHRVIFRVLNLWTAKNIAVSEPIRRYVIDMVGVAPHKVVTLRNGVNTELFRPSTAGEKAEVRRRFGLPPHGVVVGTVGRLVEWKRMELLIRAAREILVAARSTHFVIAGDGEMRQAWTDLARDLGIGAQVHFLGWRADVHKVYRALDIFCITSESGGDSFSGEGFGLVSAEAMASGLPIVAVDNDVNREIITLACALFCPPTPQGIATTVTQLILETELRAHLALAARSRAVHHYDIRRTVQELSDIYRQATEDRGRCDARQQAD
jgi:glycosyltransferase involved in cell wall biosynthesis